ncbi:MAG: fibrillarin-like rRNA/tRNA 2'-O-methyltransferase [Thaumarchaeota archaeon]|jgi:fibrillarin-like pre-rRNA processing protein|nr:fibrillarin-like rRNA/tRNA 2'-O-methyltransferase [Nitrososphaerota archaeon]
MGLRSGEIGSRLIRLEVDGQSRLATLNLAPGVSVYGEKLVVVGGKEYRVWDPFRSKLAAAILKGLKDIGLREGHSVLYLGASTGTTLSHVSDIVGERGVVFGVEFSARVARELIERVVKHRRNVVPIVADARHPRLYPSIYGKVDLVYCDIAQPDQTEIAVENCRIYLKSGGKLLLVVKCRSIDVAMEPTLVVKQEASKLKESGFKINQVVELEPFDKDHALIYAEPQE